MEDLVQNEWDAVASSWDDETSVQLYAQAAHNSLRTKLNGLGKSVIGMKVLDFGCGTGLLTERIAPFADKVVSVDTSKKMLDVLKVKAEKNGWTEKVEILSEVPKSLDCFDVVVCSSVCSFLDDYPGTVRQLVENMKPGGTWIQFDWEEEKDGPGGLSRESIERALESAGLEKVIVQQAFSIDFEDMKMQPLMGCGSKKKN